MTAARSVNTWRTDVLERTKTAVRESIDAAAEGGNPARRLGFIMSQIAAHEHDLDPIAQLRRLIYVISALVHHQRFGGLGDSQVRALADLGHSLLIVAGVQPRKSKAAVLYGELNLVLSQILRNQRQHWRSAFDYCLAGTLAGPALPGGDSFFFTGYADRLLRQGDAAGALDAYAKADAEGTPARKDKIRLGRIRCLRLAARVDEAAALLGSEPFSTDEARNEAAWERLCLDFRASGNVHPLVAATRRGREHHHLSYALEAWLITRAVHGNGDVHGLATVRYMGRKKSGLAVQGLAEVYRIAQAIERCYDESEPLPTRLRRLGDELDEAPRIHSVEVEMMVWAAAGRCLEVLDEGSTARLAMARYRAHSLALTSGADADTLRLTVDMNPSRRRS